MSEFHRMITYLYLYEQGMKSRNTGFAKVERRDQRCLLEIHMKNTGCSMSTVPVYFYVQKESRLAGILLGNFSLTRGSGDFKTILDAGNLKDSGYKLDAVKGIYIPLTEGMILVSQWDDDDFHLEDFTDISQISSSLQAADASMPAQEMENPSPIPTADMGNSPSTQDTEDSKFTGMPESTESKSTGISESTVPSPADTPRAEDSDSTSTPKTENDSTSISKAEETKPTGTVKTEDSNSAETPKTEIPKSADALKAVEALPREERQMHSIGGRQMRSISGMPSDDLAGDAEQRVPIHSPERYSPADEPEDWDLRWRFILENYPVMTPFAGDEHTFCVRMELKDLRQLPKQFWYFGNNSFLLHGFFNYRYFILGTTEEFGVKKWFIGVPGVFQNPERVMAALFGFPEFRSEKPSPINTGEFGYWYRYLNELSEPSKK